MAFYFRLFWVPALASAILLGLSWAEGELSPRATAVLVAWFLSSFALQSVDATSPLWITGIVSQTMLAVFLILKRQANQ